MKNFKFLVMALALVIGISSCKKEEKADIINPQITVSVPTLTTTPITSITNFTAQSGGNITSDNNAVITNKGIVWSTVPSPTISLSTKTVNGEGKEAFISVITGLSANTKYYLRAYATNSAGTAYGEEFSFTTNRESITGKWYIKKQVITEYENSVITSDSTETNFTLQDYLEFKSDGKGLSAINGQIETFGYTITNDGKTLIFIEESNDQTPYAIKTLNSNDLIIYGEYIYSQNSIIHKSTFELSLKR